MRADVDDHTVRAPGLRWLMIAGLLLVAGLAHAAPDPREMTAREAYAAGRYQDALDIFVKLYAEKLHPNYLRNIGRCYQNLGQPDRAISSFREYLRKARKISETERVEIEGYISEMEQLKRTQEAERASAAAAGERPLKSAPPATTLQPAPSATPAPPAPPAPPATNVVILEREPAVPRSPPPAMDLKSQPAPSAADDQPPSPFYGRWWFWAIVGGVVAAGVGGAALAGVFTRKDDAVCMGMCK